MQSFTESVVEEAALAWLESLGWTVKVIPKASRPAPVYHESDHRE